MDINGLPDWLSKIGDKIAHRKPVTPEETALVFAYAVDMRDAAHKSSMNLSMVASKLMSKVANQSPPQVTIMSGGETPESFTR